MSISFPDDNGGRFESPPTTEQMLLRLDAMVGQTMEIIRRSLTADDDESATTYWNATHQMALLGNAFVAADPALVDAPPVKPGDPPRWQPIIETKALAYAASHPNDADLQHLVTYFSADRGAHLHSLDIGVGARIWDVPKERLLDDVAAGDVSILEPHEIPDDLQLGPSAQS